MRGCLCSCSLGGAQLGLTRTVSRWRDGSAVGSARSEKRQSTGRGNLQGGKRMASGMGTFKTRTTCLPHATVGGPRSFSSRISFSPSSGRIRPFNLLPRHNQRLPELQLRQGPATNSQTVPARHPFYWFPELSRKPRYLFPGTDKLGLNCHFRLEPHQRSPGPPSPPPTGSRDPPERTLRHERPPTRALHSLPSPFSLGSSIRPRDLITLPPASTPLQATGQSLVALVN